MPESIDFSVGNMNFRKAPENKDSYYSKRTARDKNGDLTYISKRSKGMNYNNPVTNDGKPTRYFQILMEIVANPGITKREIIKNIYSKNKYKSNGSFGPIYKPNGRSSKRAAGWESEAPGYLSIYFAGLHGDGFFRVTTKGEYFPTAKGSDFVKQYIDDVDPKYLEEDNGLFDDILEEKSNNNNNNTLLSSRIKESLDFKDEEFKSISSGKYKVLKVNENSSKEEITVSELRDFLNELMEAGYGDLVVQAEGDEEVISLRDKAFIREDHGIIEFY